MSQAAHESLLPPSSSLVLGRAVQVEKRGWEIAMSFAGEDFISGYLYLTSISAEVLVSHSPAPLTLGDATVALQMAILDGRIKCDPYLHRELEKLLPGML